MKKTFFLTICAGAFIFFTNIANAAPIWKPTTPDGYKQIDWVKGRGIATFMKAPSGNGYLDFLTVIYLPYNQVKLVSSSTPKQDWGPGKPPFDATSSVHDWAFTKMMTEETKVANPDMKFFWNMPYFNVEIPVTDLSLSLKSEDETGAYITSGSRPDPDLATARRMLIVNNSAGTSSIREFDENAFMTEGEQAVEGFDPTVTPKGSDPGTSRLFVGVKPNGKELVVYCSQGATPSEASEALANAGVPVENQMQVDGGTSATCAYNLPGQYFVEPGRTLPHLMGAIPLIARGTVTQKTLNVRNGPGTKYKITRTLISKEPVMVFESKNGWFRISKNNEWVLGSYIKQN